MTHASVFSGIGGPEVAATMLGWENLFHCEINPFGRAVLDYWYPNSKSYEDITKTDFTEWRGRVNVLTGGFPCQPFSYAGKRRGAEDDRYLWPSMYRCIDEIQPDWVIAENVAGILTMVEQGEISEVANQTTLFDESNDLRGRYELREAFTLQRICNDLESYGYSVQPILIPACGVGAPHRRDRVFIVAKRKDDIDCETKYEELPEGRRPFTDPKGNGNNRRPGQVCGEKWGQTELNAESCIDGKIPAPADTISGGEGTSGTCGCAEGGRCNANQQPCQWGAETEWNNRFYAILRHANATNSVSEGLERQDESGCCQGRQRMHLRGDTSGCCGQDVWRNATDTCHAGLQEARPEQQTAGHRGFGVRTGEWVERFGRGEEIGSRWASFPSVSPVHRGNDGFPFDVDRLTLSFGKWRTEALKAYGNAIVPQVMYEIFRAIEIVENI